MKKTERLLSLDVFRGLTIAAMILVNSPGNQTHYTMIAHSSWNGCTLADLVFPFFIFMVGVSTVFSLSKAKTQEPLQNLLPKILKRSLIIFCIGLFLNAFPNHFDLTTLRFYGVLQRIAVCYFFSALLFLTTPITMQAIGFIALLVGYWLMMTVIPGQDGSSLTAQNNMGALIDSFILAPAHLYGKTYDPEGLLSTFPAIATALLGNLTGALLFSKYSNAEKFTTMSGAGVFALSAGWVWGLWFPINKDLWTSSYVLWTGGMALLVFACCYWLIEIKKWKKWSKPFEIFGVNALAAYFLHVLFLKIQLNIIFHFSTGETQDLKSFITNCFFAWTSLKNASLLYALCYTFFWLGFFTILYHKKIFIHPDSIVKKQPS